MMMMMMMMIVYVYVVYSVMNVQSNVWHLY